jgi:hypothetical protein
MDTAYDALLRYALSIAHRQRHEQEDLQAREQLALLNVADIYIDVYVHLHSALPTFVGLLDTQPCWLQSVPFFGA